MNRACRYAKVVGVGLPLTRPSAPSSRISILLWFKGIRYLDPIERVEPCESKLLGLYATVDQSNQAAHNCNQFLKFDRFGDMHLIARRQRFQTILDPGHRR